MDSDPELQKADQKVAYLDQIIKYLEQVLRGVNNRTFLIKNAIEWKKSSLVVQYNGSSKVFSTHIFVKDNYLAPQRLLAIQEIKNLYKHTTKLSNRFS